MSKEREYPTYKVCSVYDTETTNLGEGAETEAFPVLWIVNDIRDVKIPEYKFGESDDVRFYRNIWDFIEYVEDLIYWGQRNNIIPVIAAYNLMFDLQPILYELFQTWTLRVNAQTTASVYTLDIMSDDGETVLLRFWDTFFLEMNGLAAMGRTCGLPKAEGDWDYNLIRGPKTSLTEEELGYASRDVQVIPAYLRFLLESNAWLSEDMFGIRVLTKTSLVRQMARHEIGRLSYWSKSGKKWRLYQAYMMTCFQEFPTCFESYALRKACFRGGFTFTAARTATTVQRNVASLDVVSMHHTFINGRFLPVQFTPQPTEILAHIARGILETPLESVLKHYQKPFMYAFHARFEFTNLRLKEGTVFARDHIGLIASAKFTEAVYPSDFGGNEKGRAAEENTRRQGWLDHALNATFAYGKLMKADKCLIHVNEIELWNIGQVYEWDSMRVLLGEATAKFVTPPDYVTLQSNLLYRRKDDMKLVTKTYREGEPYGGVVPESIPREIAATIADGSAKQDFLEAYYQSRVKGIFNGIYGTQAMDLLRPDFRFDGEAELEVDPEKLVNSENYDDLAPEKPNVLYTYGMRIVAGSRMHLVIAILLLDRVFGERVRILGGDTDSIKISTDIDVSDEDLLAALQPIADASDLAISRTMRRVRATQPAMASSLASIGHFEIEKAYGDSTRWDYHWEAWNKARLSMSGGHFHIVCAGLPRPADRYNVETFAEDMYRAGASFEFIASKILGYNVFIKPSLSFSLQRNKPRFSARIQRDFVDYLGNKQHVDTYKSIALYETGRWLGETLSVENLENLHYQKNVLGRTIDRDEKILDVNEKELFLYVNGSEVFRAERSNKNG